MSDLLTLARAVRNRAATPATAVSSFHALGTETVKQSSAVGVGGHETTRATPLKHGNAGSIADDVDEAERAAIIEEGAGVPRAWAEAYAELEATRARHAVDPAAWLAVMNAVGRFLDRSAIAQGGGHRSGQDKRDGTPGPAPPALT